MPRDEDSTEPAAATVDGCRREMEFREFGGDFGQNFKTAIPCQLRFTADLDGGVDAFHAALDAHGYTALDSDPARRTTYEGEVASTDHYHRIKVLVFRGGVVRLYPRDGYVPDEDELADLLAALAEGFGAPLEHDPIDGEGDDA